MNDSITINRKDLEETITDIVGRSHNALAKVQSNSVDDMKVTLAVIMEKQDATNEHLTNLNGKSTRNADNISKLQMSNMWIKGIGITVVTLGGFTLGVLTYAYTNDQKTQDNANKEIAAKAESVASDLKDYQTMAQDKQQEIIKLLTGLNKK